MLRAVDLGSTRDLVSRVLFVSVSWCVVGGQPARIVGEVGEGYGVEGAAGGLARERYRLVGKS